MFRYYMNMIRHYYRSCNQISYIMKMFYGTQYYSFFIIIYIS